MNFKHQLKTFLSHQIDLYLKKNTWKLEILGHEEAGWLQKMEICQISNTNMYYFKAGKSGREQVCSYKKVNIQECKKLLDEFINSKSEEYCLKFMFKNSIYN